MIERTQKAILDAFNHLISLHSFDKISVNMIVKEAQISRATFYRYFRDKYEVMNFNYKQLLDFSSVSARCGNFEELFFALYSEAEKSWGTIRKITDTIGTNSFGEFIYTYSYDLVEKIVKQNRNGVGLTEPEKLQCDVFCHGCSFMYQQWILGKYSLPAKEAANALYAMMPTSFKYYWWKKEAS